MNRLTIDFESADALDAFLVTNAVPAEGCTRVHRHSERGGQRIYPAPGPLSAETKKKRAKGKKKASK